MTDQNQPLSRPSGEPVISPDLDQSAILFTPPPPETSENLVDRHQLPRGPRISEFLSNKIRNLSFLLIIVVVFNHSTNSDLGYDRSFSTFMSVGPMDLQKAPVLTFVECLVSDAMGKITVPFFFFASGYLFFYGWKPSFATYRKKIERRVYTILIPFLVWNLVGKVGYYVIYLASSYPSLFRNYLGGTIDFPYILAMFLRMELPYQLWFMQHLMLIMLAAPIWALFIRRLGYGFIPIIAIFYFLKFDSTLIDQRGLCLFCFGGVLGARLHTLQINKIGLQWSLLISWMIVAIAYSILALTTELNLRLMFRALVLLGLLGAWTAYDFLPRSVHDKLTKIAPYRFFVYVAHEPILTALQNGFYYYAPMTEPVYLAAYLILPSIIVAICMGAGYSIRMRWERLYFYLSGGR